MLPKLKKKKNNRKAKYPAEKKKKSQNSKMLPKQAIPLSWKEQIIAVLKSICNCPIKASLWNTHDGLQTNTQCSILFPYQLHL